VPLSVVYLTLTSWPAIFDSVTWNVSTTPVTPVPSTTDTSSTESVGSASSFVIVPMPWALAIAALVGLVRLTKKVSLPSLRLSPITVTGIVWVS